jgi:uncharacterized protein with WD repeat
MASFGKRQRDQERLAKAAQKRDRRQGRHSNPEGDTSDSQAPDSDDADSELENQKILAQIKALHGDFEAHVISFDTYEKKRDELLERIRI